MTINTQGQLQFNARLIQVIETEIELRGKGTEADPLRRVTQYWSTDGQLLAERDPFKERSEA